MRHLVLVSIALSVVSCGSDTSEKCLEQAKDLEELVSVVANRERLIDAIDHPDDVEPLLGDHLISPPYSIIHHTEIGPEILGPDSEVPALIIYVYSQDNKLDHHDFQIAFELDSCRIFNVGQVLPLAF